MIMLPYTLACVFFGMTVSCMVKYRENVMLMMVFVSIPLLFMTGVSWPQSNIPGFWQGVSWIFPSTFAARAYVRLCSMGASLYDVIDEYRILWIHTIIYFFVATMVYRHQINQSRKNMLERLSEKKEQRMAKQEQNNEKE
jgi:ABC-2 type transport system permease protein